MSSSPDEDVVGAPNSGWTVARATLGNERVSIGGSGSYYEAMAAKLVQLVQRRSDAFAGAPIRVGAFLAEDHALRLLNLRRAARSVEGAGPGPEGNITKLKVAEHMIEGAAIAAALWGARDCVAGRPRQGDWPNGDGRPWHGDRRRHVGGDPQSDCRADPGHAA
ncbi:hypothetical protein F6W99_01686 [Mycobacterium tuberculosis]|nr:hypothetical protein F6W99_01686 [Mycobacterium tuberculosis]